MTCITTNDLCIIRGDGFEQNIGLGIGFDEVVADPADYQARMVFRLEQDDSFAPLLELTATPEIVVELPESATDPRVLFTFTATPAQTQALPAYNHVFYVELVTVPGGVPRRLFQGAVDVHD